MPKLIDNYVLNRKIGAGQYGQVFRGYDRATNNDIAVKLIPRDNVKGKFKELLQSEIKVLKSCQSSNIIKLYDIKKTNNNFYLIMEYCNDGDLDAYLKKRKYLTEEEAIGILCELINGFNHLYKHKILHRDLKLANILRHDGVIKIADFGFSKILGQEQYTTTMLGSPLNMAPQVLQHNQYSNKADIYSLGVCYYWMLFGKPPFNAKNVQELQKAILKQDIQFPKTINKISDMSKILITKMLKSNANERISWEELFKHEITEFLVKKIEKDMKLTLTMGGELTENVAKLYLTQNLVIIHPSEFQKKEEVMNYVINLLNKKGGSSSFEGELLKKEIKENEVNKHLKRNELKDNDDKLEQKATEDEKISDEILYNTFNLLNERNKIIFQLSVLSELRTKQKRKYQAQVLGLIGKQVKKYFAQMEKSIRERENVYKLNYWKQFIVSPNFSNLEHFLMKETTIVNFQLDLAQKASGQTKQTMGFVVREYCLAVISNIKTEADEKNRPEWIHISHLIDILVLDQLMTQQFDFKHYFCEFGKYEMKELIDLTKKKLANIK